MWAWRRVTSCHPARQGQQRLYLPFSAFERAMDQVIWLPEFFTIQFYIYIWMCVCARAVTPFDTCRSREDWLSDWVMYIREYVNLCEYKCVCTCAYRWMSFASFHAVICPWPRTNSHHALLWFETLCLSVCHPLREHFHDTHPFVTVIAFGFFFKIFFIDATARDEELVLTQFQVLRALCRAANYTGPLASCNIQGSREVGELIRYVLCVFIICLKKRQGFFCLSCIQKACQL